MTSLSSFVVQKTVAWGATCHAESEMRTGSDKRNTRGGVRAAAAILLATSVLCANEPIGDPRPVAAISVDRAMDIETLRRWVCRTTA